MTNANTSSKKCFKCGEVKPRTEFYKHSGNSDGLLGKCKVCTKHDATAHRNNNLERIRAYDSARAKHPDRAAKALEQMRRWRAEDSRRAKAHAAVARAIRIGLIDKCPCVVCGSEKSLAHHESYDRPLEVIWYCQPHHKERHKQLAIEGIEP